MAAAHPGRPRPASPTSQSVLSSKLLRSLSPTRVYAAEDRLKPATVPDLFKQSGSLQLLHTLYVPEADKKAVQDELQRCPKLLSRLEELLEEKLSLVSHMPSGRAGWAQLQQSVDAHRQVFNAFINAFTTYKPLLVALKRVYERSLNDSLAATHDNIYMTASLSEGQYALATAVQDAQEHARAHSKTVRQEVQNILAGIQNSTTKAEKRLQAAEAEVGELRKQLADAKLAADALHASNAQMRAQLLASSTILACSQLQEQALAQ